MQLTVDIPDDRAATFRRLAQSRGLPVDRWMLEIAEHEAEILGVGSKSRSTLAEVFAKVRGVADDVDFDRDPSPGRDIDL